MAVGDRVHRVAGLHDHRPVTVRVVGEDLVGDHVARDQPADDLRPDDRRHAAAVVGSQLVAARSAGCCPSAGRSRTDHPALARFPVRGPHQLLEVAGQSVEWRFIWMPRSSNTATLDARGQPPGGLLGTSVSSTPADLAVHRDGHGGETSAITSLEAARRKAASQASLGEVLLDDDCDDRGQQPHTSRPGRTWRWKSASAAVSVTRGSMTIINHGASLAIAFSVVVLAGCRRSLVTGSCRRRTPLRSARNSPRTVEPNIRPFDPGSRRPSPARSRMSGTCAAFRTPSRSRLLFFATQVVSPDRLLRRRGSCRLRRSRERHRGARRPRGSRCPSRSPRRFHRSDGGVGGAPAHHDRSGRSRGGGLFHTCSPPRRDDSCRRGSRSNERPSSPRRISMPQLHSHKMHADCFHSGVVDSAGLAPWHRSRFVECCHVQSSISVVVDPRARCDTTRAPLKGFHDGTAHYAC